MNPKNKVQKPNIKKIYYVIAFCNILVNLDHGIIPAATKEIKADLQIAEVELGLLGSIVYGGLLLGSLVAGQTFQRFNSKSIITTTVGAYILSLLMFPISKDILFLGFSRFLVGFFQVFLVVFFPVWVDLFGMRRKTMWLTYLQLGVPFGVFLGYALTSVFVNLMNNWKMAFYTQVLMLLPCFIFFLRFDEEDLETNDSVARIQQFARRGSHTLIERNSIYDISKRNSYILPEKSVISDEDVNDNPYNNDIKLEMTEEKQVEKTLMRMYLNNLKNLWDRKLYICTLLSSSSLFFVVTGIQFWISDYMRIILKQDQQTVFLCYSISSLTAPVIGVLFGGHILDKFGGYSGPHALNICLTFGTLASLSGIPIPFFSNFKVVVALLWFLLLFGGALMPAVAGIMISAIPKYLRAFGNSNAQLIQNLLGYFPSPFVYGLVCNITGGEESRGGMILLMWWSVWGVLGLSIAKKFFANQLKKVAADNNLQLELTENPQKILMRPSFVFFRDKNTAEIFNKILDRKEKTPPVIEETEPQTKTSIKIHEMKPMNMGISLRVYESLYGDRAKGTIQNQENDIISPASKINLFRINAQPQNLEEEIFSTRVLVGSNEKKELWSPFLQVGKERNSRVSHRRKTSLFGGLGIMFGKTSMLIENEEEDDEEEDEKNQEN